MIADTTDSPVSTSPPLDAETQTLLHQYAAQVAIDNKLPPEYVLAHLSAESSGGADNRNSPAGAIGPMQLMPATAKRLGGDPYDPMQNIDMGVRELARLRDRFNGDLLKTSAGYNSNADLVDTRIRAGGLGAFPQETQDYLAKIATAYPALLDPVHRVVKSGDKAVDIPTANDLTMQNMLASAPKGLSGLMAGLGDATGVTGAADIANSAGLVPQAAGGAAPGSEPPMPSAGAMLQTGSRLGRDLTFGAGAAAGVAQFGIGSLIDAVGTRMAARQSQGETAAVAVKDAVGDLSTMDAINIGASALLGGVMGRVPKAQRELNTLPGVTPPPGLPPTPFAPPNITPGEIKGAVTAVGQDSASQAKVLIEAAKTLPERSAPFADLKQNIPLNAEHIGDGEPVLQSITVPGEYMSPPKVLQVPTGASTISSGDAYQKYIAIGDQLNSSAMRDAKGSPAYRDLLTERSNLRAHILTALPEDEAAKFSTALGTQRSMVQYEETAALFQKNIDTETGALNAKTILNSLNNQEAKALAKKGRTPDMILGSDNAAAVRQLAEETLGGQQAVRDRALNWNAAADTLRAQDAIEQTAYENAVKVHIASAKAVTAATAKLQATPGGTDALKAMTNLGGAALGEAAAHAIGGPIGAAIAFPLLLMKVSAHKDLSTLFTGLANMTPGSKTFLGQLGRLSVAVAAHSTYPYKHAAAPAPTGPPSATAPPPGLPPGSRVPPPM